MHQTRAASTRAILAGALDGVWKSFGLCKRVGITLTKQLSLHDSSLHEQ